MAYDWLAEVPCLTQETTRRSKEFFAKHGVDAFFLNFLASDEGLRVLAAWRALAAGLRGEPGGAAEEQPCGGGGGGGGQGHAGLGRAACCGGRAAGGPADPRPPAAAGQAPQQASQAAQPRAAGRGQQGRQRISTADRRAGSHYYANAAVAPAAAAPPSPPSPSEAKPSSGPAPRRPAAGGGSAGGGPAAPTPASPASAGAAAAAAAAGPRCRGVLKSFKPDLRYGFISSDHVEGDVFVLRSELPEGIIEAGRPVGFELVYSATGQPQARHVEWGAAPRFVGHLKSLGDEYGFIDCAEARREHGRDVFVTRAQLPAEALTLDYSLELSFLLVLNSRGQPQAKDVRVEPTSSSPDDPELAPPPVGATPPPPPPSDAKAAAGARVLRW